MAGPSTAPMLRVMKDTNRSQLIKQGAEAKVYLASPFPPVRRVTVEAEQQIDTAAVPSSSYGMLLKHRFPKSYRHPTLSAQLTASRTTAEARALVRCARAGVRTPRILCVDEEQGVLGLEIIDGYSVREALGGGAEETGEASSPSVPPPTTASFPLQLLDDSQARQLMPRIGQQLARMHQAHIIHGDLTTSNMMLTRDKEVLLIDFGLSANSTAVEDKAVDLYVLERAFASTHPHSDHLFDTILDSYRDTLEQHPIRYDSKAKVERGTVVGPTVWKEIKRKLDEVRLRGRKRSMVG